MVKIDLKDKKILYQLDIDCRQSNSQIGKKVGLKRDVVAYRIKRMQDEGVIKEYYTVIDAYKLGYNLFRYYLSFQYVTSDIKNEIIQHFIRYKNICTVASIKGVYDLVVVIWIKDLNDFYQFWEKTMDKYGEYLAQKSFSVYVKGVSYKSSYLLEDYEKSDRLIHEIFGVGKTIEIDDLNYRILNEISVNARIPLVDLAQKLGCSSQTVNYRFKNLVKIGVIQGFRVAIDISKLGLQRFKVNVYLREHKKRKGIIDYIKCNPNLIYISTSVGLCDLEFEFIIESVDKLIKVMDDINKNFPNSIKNYSYWEDIPPYKETFLPEL